MSGILSVKKGRGGAQQAVGLGAAEIVVAQSAGQVVEIEGLGLGQPVGKGLVAGQGLGNDVLPFMDEGQFAAGRNLRVRGQASARSGSCRSAESQG
ncbi:MAG: hypothetical protein WDN06_00330 [Asticcacaulis sp.]